MRFLRNLFERHPLIVIACGLFITFVTVSLALSAHSLLPSWFSSASQNQEEETETSQQKRGGKFPSGSRGWVSSTPIPQMDPGAAAEMLDRALESVPPDSSDIAATRKLGLKGEPSESALIVAKEKDSILVVTNLSFPENPLWFQDLLGSPPRGLRENPSRLFLGEKVTVSIVDSKNVKGRRTGTLLEIRVGQIAQISGVLQYDGGVYTLGVFAPGALDIYTEDPRTQAGTPR